MKFDESQKIIDRYRRKLEKVADEWEALRKVESYKSRFQFEANLEEARTLIECTRIELDMAIAWNKRTLLLYEDRFICETECFIEDDTKECVKRVKKMIKEIKRLLETAVKEEVWPIESGMLETDCGMLETDYWMIGTGVDVLNGEWV